MVAALAAAGKNLEFDEREEVALSSACGAADRLADLQVVYCAEVAGEARHSVLVALSAEMRLLEKSVGDHLGRLELGVGSAKSEQHQKAVRSRWDKRDAAWGRA